MLRLASAGNPNCGRRLLKEPIVTELRAAETFWKVEEYQQEYFANNPRQPYCMFVVAPKVEKFRKRFTPMAK